jgi:hypothetical protein
MTAQAGRLYLVKSEIRSSKSETSSKIQNPKLVFIVIPAYFLELGPSGLFRISDFELRIWNAKAPPELSCTRCDDGEPGGFAKPQAAAAF